MTDVILKIKVSARQFDNEFSIDEWLCFDELTPKQQYEKMLKFVVDENDHPVDRTTARQMFSKLKKGEWNQAKIDFIEAVVNSFVNPTKGDSSTSPSSAEPEKSPDGSAS